VQITERIRWMDELGVRLIPGTALGLAEVTGQLAPGYQADLLVVDGDPLTGPEALSRPALVLAAGREA
jgi:imidazolonepropionase-like amidohydrolase